MKFASLPIRIFQFWFPDSIAFFAGTWKNLMLYLEEDLAVGLMWKLLFTPLFHDASIVGRVLSFLFRITRIVIGLFAFAITTAIVLLVGGYFLVLPFLAVFDQPEFISRIVFLGCLGIFLINNFSRPYKKIWQIKENNSFWDASMIKKNDLAFANLLKSSDVVNLLSNLEIQLNSLPVFEITDKENLIREVFKLGKLCGSEYLRPGHFFVAVLPEIPGIDTFLLKLELTTDDFKETLMYLEKKRNTWRRVYIWDDDFTVHHLKGVNRGWLGIPTPALDIVAEDLTKTAAMVGFPDFIGNITLIKQAVSILSQSGNKNVILVGPPGCGKTTLIRFLAKQIVKGDAPEALATKRLMTLEPTRLLSGIRTQGELADRVKTIFEEVEAAGNVIIAVEEIQSLGEGEAGNSLNLYSLILPYLESERFQFIASTEIGNYNRTLEKNGALARLFIKIEVPPATADDSLKILEDKAITAERKDKIKVTFIAIKTAISLSRKLIHDRVLPDSAISILNEAYTLSVNRWVTKEVVRRVVSERVKVPLMEVGNADKNRLLNLEKEIHTRLINQEQAVKAVADTLRRSVTGLREETRPIGSFLFVGPTGVGKTELAKILSEVYFKTAGAYIRFDMSEYQNSESVNRLIGGSGEEGQLTEAIRQRPYALLLLDEFEKADPKILTLFLQVLEDGRLTDASGRTIDFTNTIIIVTSNAGSLTIAEGLKIGKSLEEIDKQVNSELLTIFKPELINRFDEIVLFKPLSTEDLQKIVIIKLSALQKQMKEKGYLVEFDSGLVAELTKKGFDPVMGARPLRRLIQDTLEAKLSRLILENELVKGKPFQAGVDLMSY
ncbi:MAG: ATP-dependent Clp protease ATP-binding subunit [Candidatus Daviesbacteria bacterium]|nr:ATP-dependent Clp protease ATP-binding subunit [Candidatus Daviesbacteria bacterium]